MTDAKLPKLANGSKWMKDGSVVDRDGDVVFVDGEILTGGSCYVTDALAVIRRAGLDQDLPLTCVSGSDVCRFFGDGPLNTGWCDHWQGCVRQDGSGFCSEREKR